jgi:replicative DNA helicase
MSEAELAQRFIASQAAIKGDDLRKGRLKDESKWKRVLRVAAEYDAAPLYVDDSSDIGILDVRAKARRLHQQTPDGLGLSSSTTCSSCAPTRASRTASSRSAR